MRIEAMASRDQGREFLPQRSTMDLSRREERALRSLLDHLVAGKHEEGERWEGGRVTRIGGGWNNLLYRVTSCSGDLAVKFCIRDERDRAGREYQALLALRQAGLSVAPEPLLLDRERYAKPVVVQTWLMGETSNKPPTTADEWEKLVQHLAMVHSVTPDRTSLRLRRAVVDARSADQGRRIVRQEVTRLPAEVQPTSLQKLVKRFEAAGFPAWSPGEVALCRCDNNVSNFVRRPDGWASVDWENGGWGDPAFDIAQLMTHPAYTGVPPERWIWLAKAYSRMVDDATVSRRIWAYHRILAVWWVARTARYLYESPRGLDKRLVDPPEAWEEEVKANYDHYLRLAESLYA